MSKQIQHRSSKEEQIIVLKYNSTYCLGITREMEYNFEKCTQYQVTNNSIN